MEQQPPAADQAQPPQEAVPEGQSAGPEEQQQQQQQEQPKQEQEPQQEQPKEQQPEQQPAQPQAQAEPQQAPEQASDAQQAAPQDSPSSAAPQAEVAPEAKPAEGEQQAVQQQPEEAAKVEPEVAAVRPETVSNGVSAAAAEVKEGQETAEGKQQSNGVDCGANGAAQKEESTRCNLTLVLHEKLRMELEQRPLPAAPRTGEVQLATHTVGICGSDVKYWQCGKIGNFILTKPMILGHETSAIVTQVGEGVTTLKVGDKVAVEVGLPCSHCQLCREGKYNLCSRMAFAATPPYDGTLTRYFNHPANFCFKLPEKISLEEGALLEPMAVAVHACQRAPVKLGDVVLVCGAGAVGLLSMMTAKAHGATVIMTDISEARLQFAKEMGAHETLLIKKELDPLEVAASVRQYAKKVKPDLDGVDVVLECSGAESSLHLAIHSAGVGAQIVCVGCQADMVTIPLNCAVMQEIDIKGVLRYRNCYPLAMALVESGKINLRPLITHRFPLEQSVSAFESCSRGEGLKILIKCMDEKLNLGQQESNGAN